MTFSPCWLRRLEAECGKSILQFVKVVFRPQTQRLYPAHCSKEQFSQKQFSGRALRRSTARQLEMDRTWPPSTAAQRTPGSWTKWKRTLTFQCFSTTGLVTELSQKPPMTRVSTIHRTQIYCAFDKFYSVSDVDVCTQRRL